MPAPPYAKILVSRNSGPTQSGGIVAQGGDTIALSAESIVDWKTQRWEIYSYPPGYSAPAGWLTDATGVIFSTLLTPPTFTLPALPAFGKWLLALRINEALTNDQLNAPPLADRVTAFKVLSTNGLHDGAVLEEAQFDGTAHSVGDYQRNLRIIDAVLSGFTPVGTLVPGPANTVFLNNGTGTVVVNAKIVDANVDPAAAIAGTKISPNFGSQSVVTTGPLSAGATTLSALTLSSPLTITDGGTGRTTAPAAGVVISAAGAYSSVTAADARIPFWGSSTLTSDAGFTFASSTLSVTNATIATALRLTALAGTDGPLYVTAGVVGVGPGGARSMQPLLLTDRTELAVFDTTTLPTVRRGWQATTGTASGAPLERWVLVPDDVLVDAFTRVAAKTGGTTTGSWVLETN